MVSLTHVSRRGRRRTLGVITALVLIVGTVAACGSSGAGSSGAGSSGGAGSTSAASGAAAGSPKSGGSMTVLEAVPFGTEMDSLDPGDVSGKVIYAGYLGAIFGQLFWLNEKGQMVPGLASGYSFTDSGKTMVIQLRKGVTFSDGSAFNAQAVLWNFNRDVKEAQGGCNCMPPASYAKGTTFATSGDYTVTIHMAEPLAVEAFAFSHMMWNYIASPSAYQKMGAQAFRSKPVGAGPFVVSSFSANDTLALKRNTSYWQKGRPYLDSLTFKSVQDAQSALQAMQAGQGQAFQDLDLYQLVGTFRQHFQVLANEGSTPSALQMNTLKAPFNNLTAREVLYYATDSELLNKQLFGNENTVTQSFAPKGTRFPIPTVPGYRTYDPAKAKALVKQLGGFKVTLSYLSGAADDVAKGLQSEWQQAGIKVKLDPQDNAKYFQSLHDHNFQVYLNRIGGYDPASGSVPAYFTVASPFSVVHDKQLDQLITEASSTIDQGKRAALYKQVAKMISDKAYCAFLMGGTTYTASVKSAKGPGISTPLPSTGVVPLVWWQDVSIR